MEKNRPLPDQMKRIVARGLVIRAVLQNQVKRIREAHNQTTKAVRPPNHQKKIMKLQNLKILIVQRKKIVDPAIKAVLLLSSQNMKLQSQRLINRNLDQMTKIPMEKINLHPSQMKKIPNQVKTVVLLHQKRSVELQNQRNQINRNPHQVTKNQVEKTRLVLDQMRKIVDLVIRVALQNRQKKVVQKLEIQIVQMRKMVRLDLNNLNLDQMSRMEKIGLHQDQMRKKIVAQEPLIRAVLLQHQKKKVEHQNLKSLTNQNRNQMRKKQMEKEVRLPPSQVRKMVVPRNQRINRLPSL